MRIDRMESFKTSDGLTLRYVIDDYTDPWRKADTLIPWQAGAHWPAAQ